MTPFWMALAASLLLTGAQIPTLARLGLSDVPNSRSSHSTPTPRGGGVAVLVGVIAGTSAGSASGETWFAVGAAVLLGCVGMVDDVRSLPSSVRLSAQLIIGCGTGAALAIAGPSTVPAGLVVLIVVTLGVAAFVNAFNFMDGVNGISAMNTLVAGSWFAWLGNDRGLLAVALLGGVMAGAALGFLVWNAPGHIFLGDVGSYGLGTLIAVTAALAWVGGAPALLVLAPLLVYLGDTGWALIIRARRGHRLTDAHRDHVYQRLLSAGWGHLASATWTAAFASAVCLAAATLSAYSQTLALAVIATLLLGYLSTPRALDGRISVQGGSG